MAWGPRDYGSRGAVLPWAPAVLPHSSTVLSRVPTVLPLSREQYYRKPINSSQDKAKRINGGCSKVQGKGGDKEENVYVMIPPEPFQRGPPLNSTALLRLKSTKKKCRTMPSSIVFEGHRIFSCLVMKRLINSRHTISPQKHCHQSPKHLRDKYALTISPFLVD